MAATASAVDRVPIQIVRVPCGSESCSQITLECDRNSFEESMSCVSRFVENNVRTAYDTIDARLTQGELEEQKTKLRHKIQKHFSGGAPVNDEQVAMMVVQIKSVPLLTACVESGYEQVSMYFSVTAKIKGLSKNVKASEICTLCGIQVKLYGDCFFSRVRDDKVNFERLNFTLQELSSDSNWIRLAFSQTKSPPQPSDEQKLMQMISQHQHEREQQRQQQPPPKPTPQHKCVACSKPAGLRCSRCRLVHYCSPLCQVTHWHIHKKVCKKAP